MPRPLALLLSIVLAFLAGHTDSSGSETGRRPSHGAAQAGLVDGGGPQRTLAAMECVEEERTELSEGEEDDDSCSRSEVDRRPTRAAPDRAFARGRGARASGPVDAERVRGPPAA